jgi:hypothetical protein
MALMPTERMGPAARSFPTGQARGLKAHAEAHDCIMVRIRTDLPDTSSRREDAPQWRAPLGSYPDRQCQTPELRRRKPISLFILPPRAQASRRCQTQAPLSGKPPSCAKRFGPLTPSARSANLIAGDGTKNGPSRSEQRTGNKPKTTTRQEKPHTSSNPLPSSAESGANLTSSFKRRRSIRWRRVVTRSASPAATP